MTLYPSQVGQVERLRASGFSLNEICTLTGHDAASVARVLRNRNYRREELVLVANSYLRRKPPFWWKGTVAAWRFCIYSNFADVLPAME